MKGVVNSKLVAKLCSGFSSDHVMTREEVMALFDSLEEEHKCDSELAELIENFYSEWI